MLQYVKASLSSTDRITLTHSTQGTFSLGMGIHHIQYVLHYIIIGPLTHITYKYTLYATMCVCVCMCVFVCVCVCVCANMCVHVCMCMLECGCLYIYYACVRVYGS